MGFGLKVFTWVALLATCQGAPGDVSYMNEREFQIPITLPADPAFQSEIEQLFLFVSTDEGKTWRQEAVASPRDRHFPFVARNDGNYWFSVSIVDKSNRQYPPDVSAVPPALKVVVDTRKPIVRIANAERSGDYVTVGWDVKDENVDLSSFQLEYRTSDSPTWYVVPVTPPAATGQKRWQLAAAGKVTVRLQVQDAAGNVGSTTTEIAPEAPSNLVASPAAPPPSNPMPPPSLPAAKPEEPRPNGGWQRASETATLTRHEASSGERLAPPAFPASSGVANAVIPADEAGPRVIARVSNPPMMPPPSSISPPAGSPAPPHGATPPAGSAGTRASKTTLPALQFANSLHVELNYKISTIGPSGVEKVELWLTQDDGRTWRRFAEDLDCEPPFEVDLPGEGVYGFSIVVLSKAGMGRKAPQPGEAPALRLEVDTTLPEAELYAVEADPRRKDALYLRWSATDRNLTSRPVTLQWSEKEGGPWHDIARDVPNTGRYEWTMPANLPYRVFLKLEVRDQAGNVAVAETREPVLVDLTEPEAELIGISTRKKAD